MGVLQLRNRSRKLVPRHAMPCVQDCDASSQPCKAQQMQAMSLYRAIGDLETILSCVICNSYTTLQVHKDEMLPACTALQLRLQLHGQRYIERSTVTSWCSRYDEIKSTLVLRDQLLCVHVFSDQPLYITWLLQCNLQAQIHLHPDSGLAYIHRRLHHPLPPCTVR